MSLEEQPIVIEECESDGVTENPTISSDDVKTLEDGQWLNDKVSIIIS